MKHKHRGCCLTQDYDDYADLTGEWQQDFKDAIRG